MTKWLLSIVGVVFLGVMLDLLYPDGKTNTLCRAIFGLITVFVIISPILQFDIDAINDDINISAFDNNIKSAYDNNTKRVIINALKSKGFEGVIVDLDSNMDNNVYEITNIYLDSTNIVLDKNLANINKYEVLTNEVSDVLKIIPERIIIYG